MIYHAIVEKRPQNAHTGIKYVLGEVGHEFPCRTFRLENRTSCSDIPLLPEILLVNDSKNRIANLFRNFRKLFVNSERVFRQGTLQDLVRDKGRLEEALVVKFTRQLLSAVDYLHTNGKKHIVHKDIKG